MLSDPYAYGGVWLELLLVYLLLWTALTVVWPFLVELCDDLDELEQLQQHIPNLTEAETDGARLANTKLAMALFQADRGAEFSVENMAATLRKGRLDGGSKLDRILLVLGHLDLVIAGGKVNHRARPDGLDEGHFHVEAGASDFSRLNVDVLGPHAEDHLGLGRDA